MTEYTYVQCPKCGKPVRRGDHTNPKYGDHPNLAVALMVHYEAHHPSVPFLAVARAVVETCGP